MADTPAKQALLHKAAFDSLGFAAQLLNPQAEIFAALIRAESDMHNFLHITDPTTYIKALNSKGLSQQVKLAKAALAFILAVQEVKSELLPHEELNGREHNDMPGVQG